MNSKLNYALALLKAIALLRRMFERIAFNLNFEYHCRKLREMGDKPFISFVVPTRNEAGYLPKLLMSINYIAQVCRVPIETIVVDYRSEDGTPDIAKKMSAKVVEVDKPGIGYASYIGVLSAKGDIIIRTDADVIMTPSAIQETIKVFMDNPEKLIATVGHIMLPIRSEDLTTNLMAYLYDYYIRRPYNTTGYFIAFKKSVVERVNFNLKLRVHEDYDFGRRAYEIFGLRSMYYNPFVAVFVSARLIKKKGLGRYLLDWLGITKSGIISYSQLVADHGL
jgi:cellulose synthase/poly-beta-1,6-N-acetylglucosamine synthase-like glycosyltransferase